MNIVSETSASLPGNLYTLAAAYRHKVFVERLCWELASQDGLEEDQFDRPDTVYVVACNESGNVCGCARLLPTTGPYLLAEVFPQLLNGAVPPNSPEIWELSRFAAVDWQGNSPSALAQFSSPIAIKLLEEAIACAASRGAKQLITVSPLGVERLLQRAGFRAHRAGPPVITDGRPLFACWIEVET